MEADSEKRMKDGNTLRCDHTVKLVTTKRRCYNYSPNELDNRHMEQMDSQQYVREYSLQPITSNVMW